MSATIVLPALGESVSEGTITRWLKQVGETVEAGEPIAEVSTDKVDTEIVSTVSGVIEAVLVQLDETVDVGTVIALVAEQDRSEAVRAGRPNESEASATTSPVVATEASERAPRFFLSPLVRALMRDHGVDPSTISGSGRGGRIRRDDVLAAISGSTTSEGVPPAFLSPLVRALVKEHGVDPSTVSGTGLGGRVRRDDVLAAVEVVAATPAEVPPSPEAAVLRGTSVTMSRERSVLAERDVGSMDSTAQLTTVVEIDVTRIDQLRRGYGEAFRQRTGAELSFLPFFALAATEALRTYPMINARIEGDRLFYPDAEHVIVAIDTERGLCNPVIKDAGELTIEGFARAIDEVAARARSGELAPNDASGGTFTITNTGSRGALFETPIVSLPQVANLGLGAVTRRPVAVNREGEEGIAVHSMVYMALSYDHRAVDGADAARFLGAMKGRLEAAEFHLLT